MTGKSETAHPCQPPSDNWSRTGDQLDSWKEIAAYLRREVRTVQLWEKHEGLPVHRHFHKRLGSVFALRSEIDKWKQRVARTPQGCETPGKSSPTRNRITICSLPWNGAAIGSAWRECCDLLVARTIAAVENAHPGELCVKGSRSRQSWNQENLSRPESNDSIDYSLHWTFQEETNDLKVTVALLISDSEVEVWSHTNRCSPKDALRLSSYLAEQIVQYLWLKMLSSARPAGAARHPAKCRSREEYLRGRYFWNQRNETGLRKAIACFESVMREDPEFALPYSGLADSLTLLSFYEIVSPAEVMPAARVAAKKAMELDPNSAEAHTSLADVFLHFDRDWQSADREYRLAIQCDPDYALGYHWYANLLSARGQHEAARMAILHALEINPVSIITLVWAGVTSHLAHRFDEAIRHYQNALELDSSFVWAHMYLAQSLEQKGNFNAALQEFETATRLSGGENHCVKAMMAHAYAVAGESAAAREVLQEVGEASPRSMPSYDIAATYAALGESRPMIDWLNRACRERNMKLFALTQDPRFDSVRRSCGFRQVLARVGLAEYNLSYS